MLRLQTTQAQDDNAVLRGKLQGRSLVLRYKRRQRHGLKTRHIEEQVSFAEWSA
jgi:hypothetical protein